MREDELSGTIQAIASQLEESEYLTRQIERGRRRLWVTTALRVAAWAVGVDEVKAADAVAIDGGTLIVVATTARVVEVTAVGDIENDMPTEEPTVSVRVWSCQRLLEMETGVRPIVDPQFGTQGLSTSWLRVRAESGRELRLPLDPSVWQSHRGYTALADAWRDQIV